MKGKEFRDPKGKGPVAYGNIMEKLNISRKEVEEEAERLGLKLDEKMFEVKKSQRGRPKKSTDVVDTASESSEPEKRGRGRPKKEKKTVTEDSSDILKNLLNNDNTTMKNNNPIVTSESSVKEPAIEEPVIEKPVIEEPESDVEESDDEESDDEGLAVTEFTHKGIKYLKAEDNTLYDVNTHEEIGMWDPNAKKVIV